MTDRENVKLSMYQTVYGICKENLSIIQSVDLLNSVYQEFEQKLNQINDLSVK